MKVTLEICAQQFEFMAKMLRNARTVRKVVDGKPSGKPIPTWKVVADECDIAAKKIREAQPE